MSFARSIRLALVLASAARVRVAVTAVLVAISLFGFMATSALADLAGKELENVEQRINGGEGSYAVNVGESTGLRAPEFIDILRPELEKLEAFDVYYIESFANVPPRCGEEAAIDYGLPYLFIYDGMGSPVHPDPESSVILPCINGQKVDDASIAQTIGDRLQEWGEGFVASPDYRMLVAESTAARPQLRVVFRLHSHGDQSPLIREVLEAAFQSHPQHLGISVFVGQADTVDPDLERAVRGAILIYSVIGLSVLLVGGAASLVVQMLVWKSRSWLVGLARSLGATRPHIATMVATDTLVVVVLAALLAVVTAALAQPSITEFARSAFHSEIELAPATRYLRLGGAVLAVAVLAGLAPTVRALRANPVDLLSDR